MGRVKKKMKEEDSFLKRERKNINFTDSKKRSTMAQPKHISMKKKKEREKRKGKAHCRKEWKEIKNKNNQHKHISTVAAV